ncbi:MAG: hypothetical protein V1790_09940 [Planctomycetota bacterium]
MRANARVPPACQQALNPNPERERRVYQSVERERRDPSEPPKTFTDTGAETGKETP